MILDAKPLQPGWLIEWDKDNLRLLTPENRPALELPPNQLHRVIHVLRLRQPVRAICWWVSVAPETPPQWMLYFGWLIHIVLLRPLLSAQSAVMSGRW